MPAVVKLLMVRQTWDPLAFIWPMRGHFSALWSAPSLETMMSSNLSGQTTWRFLDRKIDQNPVAVCRWRCVRGVRRALHVDWLMDFCLRCSGLWKCVSAQVRNDPEIYAHGAGQRKPHCPMGRPAKGEQRTPEHPETAAVAAQTRISSWWWMD